MSLPRQFFACGMLLAALAASAPAQPGFPPAGTPAPPEVKPLAEALVSALNRNEPESALKLFHPQCCVTWANTETSRGREGLRAFHQLLLGGPVKRVESFSCEVRVDEAVSLFAGGQAALAAGAFNQRFKLAGGRKIDLQGRWSATLVPEGGQWLILNLQLSVDPFANSLLNLAKQAGWVVGVVSLLVGAGVGWKLGRRKHAPAKS